MLSPQAIKKSKPYHREEERVLRELLLRNSDVGTANFISVGAGELWYLRFWLKFARQYISIEPLTKVFLNKDVEYLVRQMKTITLLEKKFGDVDEGDIPPGTSIYVFLFNILAYIENPIAAINKLLREGDILFISSWNSAPEAKELRAKYFNYLNSFEKKSIIDPEKTVGLCILDNFPFQSLKHYKKHQRFIGKITDVLIIYT